MALEMAKRDFNELTVINIATGLGDRPGVPTGAIVQNLHNGKKEIAVRDLSAACPGFIHLLQLTYADLDSVDYGNGGPQVVAAGEPASRGINPHLKATYLIFGDGGGAFVIDRVRVDKSLPKAKFSFRSDGRFVELLSVPAGGSEKPITHEGLDAHENAIHMNGPKVLEIAPTEMAYVIEAVMEKAGASFSDIAKIIPHQANLEIIQKVAKLFNLSMDRFFVNIQHYGNTSAASIPIAVREAWEQGVIGKGDIILTPTFGAGFNAAAGFIPLNSLPEAPQPAQQ